MRLISHPPYLPNLTPFDLAIFPHIKIQLKGVRFDTLNDLQTALNGILKSTNELYEDIVINQRVVRH